MGAFDDIETNVNVPIRIKSKEIQILFTKIYFSKCKREKQKSSYAAFKP